MTKKLRENIKRNYALILAIVVLILYHIRFFSIRTMINVDEFSSLAVPAFFAGHDWNIAANWHGYGYTIIFTWFFKVFHHFNSIYNIVQMGSLLLNIGCLYIIYMILWKIVQLPKHIGAISAAVYMLGTLSPYDEVPISALSEIPFAFLFLCLIYCIMRTNQMIGKKRMIYSALCGGIMAYGSLIHSRAIIMYIAVVAALLLTKLAAKKYLINVPLFLGSFIGIMLVLSIIDMSIIERVYYAGEIKNSVSDISGKVSGNLLKLLSKEKLEQCIMTFFSLLSTLILWSFGILSNLLAGGFYTIFSYKKLSRQSNALSENNFFLAAIGLLAVIGMNFALGLSSTGDIGKENYRWFSYIRYSLPFIGPLFIQGVWMLYHNYFQKMKIVFCAGMLSVFAVKYLLIIIVPILNSSGYGLKYNILGHINFGGRAVTASQMYALFGMVTLFAACMVSILLFRAKKFVWLPYLLFSFMIHMNTYQYYMSRDLDNIKRTSESSSVILEIEDAVKENDITIYYGGSSKFTYYLRLEQWEIDMIHRDTINFVDWEGAVYLTDIFSSGETENVQYSFQIEENQFLLTSNKEIGEALKEKYEVCQ